MHISFTTIPASLHLAKNMDKRLFTNLRRKLILELKRESKIQIRMFYKTVATWDSKPFFTYEIEDNGDQVSAVVYTADKIYYFLDRGTKIRFATMTKDFRPKTRPFVIGSSRGRGGLKYVSTRHPRPGIEPRRFTDEIFDRRRNIFIRNISEISRKEFDKFWRNLLNG